MKRKLLRFFYLGTFCFFFLHGNARLQAQSHPWTAIGPDGGDARSFAADPKNPQHIYLGTTTSLIYQSEDGGSTWKRIARIGKDDDLVVDSLVVDNSDPRTLLAGVWQVDRPSGGIYISHDGGVTWTPSSDIQGQSVRALVQARSNPKIFVAGTLDGVFRTEDSGQHWKQISPPGSGEIHEVESAAIDPYDPNTIYVGTWHLPWKTTDGGEHWHNIKQGLIDDSDVFSIIIDPTRPTVIYTSACSGIYRSDTAGELYRKVQGIPSTARRTRVLMQDPADRKTVYAGTTEGLYKTVDDGVNWTRMTGPDVIINDIYVDPSNPRHVLLATDRSGVLQSSDAGTSFSASNAGFSQRQVATILADAKHPGTIYAGVINDKIYGGVFVTENNGSTWQQRSQGLNGRDVFALAEADDGTLLAGTGHGIVRWNGSLWEQDGNTISYVDVQKPVRATKKGKRTVTRKTTQVARPGSPIDSRVNDISTSGAFWFAATSDGVYRSPNQGTIWNGPVLKGQNFLFVRSKGNEVLAANRYQLMISTDNGNTWTSVTLPSKLSGVQAVSTAPDDSLWIGGREGVFYSTDQGHTWQRMDTLPLADINGLSFNTQLNRLLVTSARSTVVLGIDVQSKTWKWWDTGWTVRAVRSLGDRLVAASIYNGVVLEPGAEGEEKAAKANPATEAQR
jgi:photosystem II stability/assembly factor-like uncharacterized protein